MNENNLYRIQFERKWLFFLTVYFAIEFTRIHTLASLDFLDPNKFTVIILCIFLWKNGNLANIIKGQIKLILCFTCLLAVYVPLATNNYYAYQTARLMAIYIPILLSIAVLINTRERIIWLLGLFTALIAFNAIYGIFNGGRGPGGTVGDENDLGLFFVTFLPFLFFSSSHFKEKYKKLMINIIIVVSLIAFVLTFSRGAFVGILAMGFVYWWYSQKKFQIAILFSLLTILFIIYAGDEYKQEMTTITDTSSGTAKIRFESWKSGFNMFLHNPLGVGGNNFQIHFDEYQTDYFKREMWGRVAHSLWFTLIPETGIVGMILYFLIIYHVLKDIFYVRRLSAYRLRSNIDDSFYYDISTALLASLVGFFAAGSLLSVLYYPYFWILAVLVFAIRNVFNKSNVQPIT